MARAARRCASERLQIGTGVYRLPRKCGFSATQSHNSGDSPKIFVVDFLMKAAVVSPRFWALRSCSPCWKGTAMSKAIDRFIEAQEGERNAKRRLQEIVNQFLRVAERVSSWQNADFEWRHDDAAHPVRRSGHRKKEIIRTTDIPTISDVRAAVAEADIAAQETSGCHGWSNSGRTAGDFALQMMPPRPPQALLA